VLGDGDSGGETRSEQDGEAGCPDYGEEAAGAGEGEDVGRGGALAEDEEEDFDGGCQGGIVVEGAWLWVGWRGGVSLVGVAAKGGCFLMRGEVDAREVWCLSYWSLFGLDYHSGKMRKGGSLLSLEKAKKANPFLGALIGQISLYARIFSFRGLTLFFSSLLKQRLASNKLRIVAN